MDIREYIRQETLLFDGAMGTYFASLPHRAEERCELGNLHHTEEIAAIHREYLEAGCRAIKTNTFSVGTDLAAGDDTLAQSIIEAGCRIAMDAAADYDAYVFADLGPAPQSGVLSPAENYCRQAEWFLGCGVRHFLVETLANDDGLAELAAFLKAAAPEAFLLVSYAVGADGVTRDGLSGRGLFARTAAMEGVDAVGFNCVSGPHHLLEYIRTLDKKDVTLSVMPNAGYPTVLGRRTVFQGKPMYFGEKLSQIAHSGAGIVGGCCGTTPAHMAAAASALKTAPRREPPSVTVAGNGEKAPHSNPITEKFAAGKRVLAVELDPPADDSIQPFMEGVRVLKEAGADLVTIADCPIGRPRADSSLLACKVKRELGMEPLPHMTCRDRNRNATKALLLGLSMEGVHNVLLVTGDPIPTENRDEVKTVFNFNSRKLARYVTELNNQLTTPFNIFGALNVNARNFDMQLKIAREKEENGVMGFLTQPVLSAEALENLKLARRELKGRILGGIFPVVSHRNACFLNNEIAGMRVCDEIVDLYAGKDREEAEALAVAISAAIAREIEPYTDGLYLMTPFKRVELMRRIIEAL